MPKSAVRWTVCAKKVQFCILHKSGLRDTSWALCNSCVQHHKQCSTKTSLKFYEYCLVTQATMEKIDLSAAMTHKVAELKLPCFEIDSSK